MLKKLKNIEDKNDNNLRAIEGPRREDSDPRISFNNFRQRLTQEGIDIFDRIVNERNQFNNYIENNFRGGNNRQYNFSGYIRIGAPDYDYARLERYRPRPSSNYYLLRESAKNNIEHLKNGRELTINAFRNRIFPLSDPRFYPQNREDESDSDDESDSSNDGNGDEDPSGGTSGSNNLDRPSRNRGPSGNHNSDDSSGSNDSDGPPRNGEPSGSNNSRPLIVSNNFK